METAGNNSPLDLLISQELKKHFKNLPSWSAWSTWLRVVYGLDLEEGDVDFFRQFTGLIIPRPGGYESIFTIVGRSGGKSTIAGLCAAWTLLMVPNGNVMVIAPRLKQTRPIVRANFRFSFGIQGLCQKGEF